MDNTVLVESKIRQKLKLACTLMCVFCLIFIAFVVIVAMIEKHNLNGQTDEVSGVLSEVYVEGSNTLTIDGDKLYNVVWNDKESNIDMTTLQGKTITLIIARNTFASNPWAFGLVVDGETIVDYQATLSSKRASNNEMKTVVIAVAAVFCVATCGLFIWRFNIQPLVERELYKEFGEFLSQRQPTSPKRKIMIVYVAVYFAVILALFVTSVVLDPEAETIPELSTAAKAVLWTLLAFVVVGLAGLFVLKEWLARQEINFYNEKLPFDFNDISHAPLRKKVKVELQKEILKEREAHPHTYADGGNGYDVTFDKTGVTLTVPMDEFAPSATPQQMPDAEAVFGDNPFDENEASVNKNALFLTYEQLNFEAIAYYRKNVRPMMIIIKSRLAKTEDLPEEFVNDIHIPFDANLLRTLNSFNVKVENLEYLLQNKKRLMLENCLTFSKNKSKSTIQ